MLLPGKAVVLHVVLVGVLHQLALAVVVAAALKAALGLRTGLLLGEAETHGAEVLPALLAAALGSLGPGQFLPLGQLGLQRIVLLALGDKGHMAGDGLTVQVRVDGGGGLIGLGNGRDGDARTAVGDVARGEHAVQIGGEADLVGGDVAPVQGQARVLKAGEVSRLTDGGNDAVRLKDLKLAGDGHGGAAAPLVGLAQLHLLELHGGDSAVLADDLGGVGEEVEVHALLQRLLDLLGLGGHFVAAAAVDHIHFLRAHAHGGAAGVHGGVAAADDHNGLAHVHALAGAHLAQEGDPVEHAVQIVAGAAHTAALPRARGHQNGVVFRAEVREAHIAAQLHVVFHLHAQLTDLFHLGRQHLLGQAVLGDAVAQHTAHLGHGVHHGDVVALEGQIVCGGQTGGAAADDANGLAGGVGLLRPVGVGGAHILIGGKGLELRDGDGLLHQTAAAVQLAGMGADPADGGRNGDLLLDDPHGLPVVAQRDLLDVSLTVGLRRAAQGAGAAAVALVIAHQQLQRDPALTVDALGPGVDDLPVGGHGGAGAQQLGVALRLHHADAAGAAGLYDLVVAEHGDLDPRGGGDLKDRLALLPDTLDTINGQCNLSHVRTLLTP